MGSSDWSSPVVALLHLSLPSTSLPSLVLLHLPHYVCVPPSSLLLRGVRAVGVAGDLVVKVFAFGDTL